MVKIAQMVVNMASEIGHYLSDEKCCPAKTTQNDILDFLGTIIEEQESSYELKHSDLPEMKKAINEYFEHVTGEKNKLIIEESAEAVAQAVVDAAVIATAACSWAPGINFAIGAVALAAQATATGLEIAAEKLEKTVVGDISDSVNNIGVNPAFAWVKPYTDAVNTNTLFFPRLQLGASNAHMRAMFLGAVVATKKEKENNGKCTKEDLKQMFIDWYNASEADKELVSEFTDYLQKMSDNPIYSEKLNIKFKALMDKVPAVYKRIYVGIMMAITFAVVLKQGIQFYTAWANTRILAELADMELVVLDENGEVAAVGAEGEEAIVTMGSAFLVAVEVLAGVASLVFLGLEIYSVVETDVNLTKAIKDSKDAITDYYTDIVKQPVTSKEIEKSQ